MKQFIIIFISILTQTITLHAQEKTSLVISAGKLKNLSIGDDLEVVLINASSQQSDIRINSEISSKLSIRVNDGTMEIHRESAFSSNAIIYVLVDGLKNLTVGKNSQIITHGMLQSAVINVFASSGSVARITTSGKVKAFSADDSEVSLKKVVNYPRAVTPAF